MAKLFLKKLSIMVVFGILTLFLAGFVCAVFGFTENLTVGNYLPYAIVLLVCAVALFVAMCALRVHDAASKTAYMVGVGSVKPPFLKRIRHILQSRELWAEVIAESAIALALTLYVALTAERSQGITLVLAALTTFLMLTVPFFVLDVASWTIVHSIWTRYLRLDDTEKTPESKIISLIVCVLTLFFVAMCVLGFLLSAAWLLLLSPIPLAIGCLLITYFRRFRK